MYKAQERIHRSVADLRLLAIPTSCRRVAACNPNWGRLSRFAPPCGIASFCTGHCSTCAALGIKAMGLDVIPTFLRFDTGSLVRVPDITRWQLTTGVALVKGLNPTLHSTS